MLTLGLESSCDETSCALVENGKILANRIASQDIHAAYGGVIPELASRAHLQIFPKLLAAVAQDAEVSLEDVELISVANTPGLIGALSVGVNFAKGLASGLKKTLIGVNHVEAHLYAACLEEPSIRFPALGLAISGAHTSLFLMPNATTFLLIGKTRDDAIGETFDKVARFLGLPYPGGQKLEELAQDGDEEAYPFSRAKVSGNDFSFSGLKTAVLYALKGNNSSAKAPFPEVSETQKRNIAASFQKAAFMTIAQKLPDIVKAFSCESLIVGGGVANNRYFRRLLNQTCSLPTYFPSSQLCSDNAAMIAGLGERLFCNQTYVSKEVIPCARYQWESACLSH
ncbi:tRNA (adenosine(37)-N6)-threonylcarbamoyltransferase complex transferase subunit TsaD [Chlamydia muridarum str. Nigg]|uniref:tRNA N6-adenosine threonylcarbamoyltransferase n=2 Tax=Chlamydia muridarum TaxID=83560 RepID=TSAD_CHLMU|nr:tRNA (adenosine(37)-N6)-threonylcarbamoyltransferase complex transferase subunit TsaD [Chlamydia muridarum]Q9PKJ5.1 RecName: Full=tRNA N6-adenosine threonylcarbamoyltransferase; AltName: Full=N6-L-threonylcarbamoyladenine synthase; Short=t(6)A synthase; AltName: Full=t(6)A37 threonylcarbamoyladenosine biosynthesis protein TsaD; AltName: Full=tRNA threonylcarbamoyladenosine biosynthesis protein TsaD [Chlamydia muridarum str. Nigg]AAF73560.1 O-sialoglycoprotein endopeptidase [Chlamydia muridarum